MVVAVGDVEIAVVVQGQPHRRLELVGCRALAAPLRREGVVGTAGASAVEADRGAGTAPSAGATVVRIGLQRVEAEAAAAASDGRVRAGTFLVLADCAATASIARAAPPVEFDAGGGGLHQAKRARVRPSPDPDRAPNWRRDRPSPTMRVKLQTSLCPRIAPRSGAARTRRRSPSPVETVAPRPIRGQRPQPGERYDPDGTFAFAEGGPPGVPNWHESARCHGAYIRQTANRGEPRRAFQDYRGLAWRRCND